MSWQACLQGPRKPPIWMGALAVCVLGVSEWGRESPVTCTTSCSSATSPDLHLGEMIRPEAGLLDYELRPCRVCEVRWDGVEGQVALNLPSTWLHTQVRGELRSSPQLGPHSPSSHHSQQLVARRMQWW